MKKSRVLTASVKITSSEPNWGSWEGCVCVQTWRDAPHPRLTASSLRLSLWKRIVDFGLLIQSVSFALFNLCQQMFSLLLLGLWTETRHFVVAVSACCLRDNKFLYFLFLNTHQYIVYENTITIFGSHLNHLVSFFKLRLEWFHVYSLKTVLFVGNRGISLTCVLTPCRVFGVCMMLITLGAIGAAAWIVGQSVNAD